MISGEVFADPAETLRFDSKVRGKVVLGNATHDLRAVCYKFKITFLGVEV